MAEFPLAKFRLIYPHFADKSDEEVLATAELAECYMSAYGCACADQLWMLMVAHLFQLAANAAAGGGGQQVASASIDGVSVSFSAPTSSGAWSYWLNGTPFGQQFAALYARCNSGGRYAGAFPERAAFRNVGGRFTNGGRLR